jgi:hypothetical protein
MTVRSSTPHRPATATAKTTITTVMTTGRAGRPKSPVSCHQQHADANEWPTAQRLDGFGCELGAAIFFYLQLFYFVLLARGSS